MLKIPLKTAAKLHISEALGIVFIFATLYGFWTVVLAVPVIWCLLYLTKWGRPIWVGRPALLIQMLAIPICALPTVIARYWFKDAVLLVALVGLAVFILIQILAYQHNKELLAFNEDEHVDTHDS